MDYPYSDQVKAKSEVAEGSFIMFSEKGCNVLDSGTVFYRDGDHIKVSFEDNNGNEEVADFDLNNLVLYKGKDWDDN